MRLRRMSQKTPIFRHPGTVKMRLALKRECNFHLSERPPTCHQKWTENGGEMLPKSVQRHYEVAPRVFPTKSQKESPTPRPKGPQNDPREGSHTWCPGALLPATGASCDIGRLFGLLGTLLARISGVWAPNVESMSPRFLTGFQASRSPMWTVSLASGFPVSCSTDRHTARSIAASGALRGGQGAMCTVPGTGYWLHCTTPLSTSTSGVKRSWMAGFWDAVSWTGFQASAIPVCIQLCC